MSLLKLPLVASTLSSSPAAARRIAASISLTVVLPLLPVMATSGMSNCLRQCAASLPSAMRVSSTSRIEERGARSERICVVTFARSPGQQPHRACARRRTNLAPSKCSPLRAMKRSPCWIVRVSVETAAKRTSAPSMLCVQRLRSLGEQHHSQRSSGFHTLNARCAISASENG